MNLSKNWLADFVDVSDITDKEYCDRMTDTGSKVEGYELLGDDIENVVVARITKIAPHENSDHLQICQVDIGGGNTVAAQKPSAGATIEKQDGKIYLYTDSSLVTNEVTVPDLVGDNPARANAILIGLGLNIKIEGSKNHLTGTSAKVIEQSIAPGTKVAKGEVIILTFRHMDGDEEPNYRD